MKLFDSFRGWIPIRLTRNLSRLSQIQWRFLRGISGKKILFRENFPNFFCKPKPILYQNWWNFTQLSAILLWFCIALKKFTQVLSYVVCTQIRSHVHKEITEGRYGEEKPGRFVFEKPVLFTLSLGLTTPSSLGILVWNFYQMFVTVSIEFWHRLELQIRPTRFAINF